jgi:hypothetical protein
MGIFPKCGSAFSVDNVSTVFSLQHLICIICSYTIYVVRLKQCKAVRPSGRKPSELLRYQ